MNKSQLIEAVSEEAGFSKVDTERALVALIDTIAISVKNGDKVTIFGLGTFERVIRSSRVGINPTTGEKILIKAKNAPKFKASKSFKDFVA